MGRISRNSQILASVEYNLSLQWPLFKSLLNKPEDVRAVEVNVCILQCTILQTTVQRQKDGPLQNIAIYPHRDGILEDYFFSLIYLLVMTGCNSQYVLPSFSSAALKTKSGKIQQPGVIPLVWTLWWYPKQIQIIEWLSTATSPPIVIEEARIKL